MISCLKNINKGSKQCRMFKIPKSHVHIRGKMSYVRYNVQCLRDNKKKIGSCSTNFHNTLSQISASSSFRLKISIIFNTCIIVSKLHSFTMHDMKSTLMLLTFFTMTPENFRLDKDTRFSHFLNLRKKSIFVPFFSTVIKRKSERVIIKKLYKLCHILTFH